MIVIRSRQLLQTDDAVLHGKLQHLAVYYYSLLNFEMRQAAAALKDLSDAGRMAKLAELKAAYGQLFLFC